MPFLASEGCFWPLTASMTSEVKNNYAYVITQDICNKFIEVNFCVGCMVSTLNILRLLIRCPKCTLDILALIPFKLQHFENPAIVAIKSDIVTSFLVKSIKSDIWLQFEKNEKKIRQMVLPRRVKRCERIH